MPKGWLVAGLVMIFRCRNYSIRQTTIMRTSIDRIHFVSHLHCRKKRIRSDSWQIGKLNGSGMESEPNFLPLEEARECYGREEKNQLKNHFLRFWNVSLIYLRVFVLTAKYLRGAGRDYGRFRGYKKGSAENNPGPLFKRKNPYGFRPTTYLGSMEMTYGHNQYQNEENSWRN